MLTDLADLPALKAVWHSGFGDSEETMALFFENAYSPDRTRYLRIDGRIVAALYWFDCLAYGQRIAYLYAIATDAAYRGRGCCRALMEDTHRHLAALGYAGALLVPASAPLFDFYAKLGYRTCSSIGKLSCIGNGEAIDLFPVEKNEYAARRRALLPHGGVIQEGENLDYLAAQYGLYAGDGFLLAAHREGDTLYVPELLGAPTIAPAIVSALRAQMGEFRIPGDAAPFAMYLALDQTPPPTYFALAFD